MVMDLGGLLYWWLCDSFVLTRGRKTHCVVLGRRKQRETQKEKLRRKEMCKVFTVHANTCGSLIIGCFAYSGMMCKLRNIRIVTYGNEAWRGRFYLSYP